MLLFQFSDPEMVKTAGVSRMSSFSALIILKYCLYGTSGNDSDPSGLCVNVRFRVKFDIAHFWKTYV